MYQENHIYSIEGIRVSEDLYKCFGKKPKLYNINGIKVIEAKKDTAFLNGIGFSHKLRSNKYLVVTSDRKTDFQSIFKDVCKNNNWNFLMYGGIVDSDQPAQLFDMEYSKVSALIRLRDFKDTVSGIVKRFVNEVSKL